MSMQIIDWKEFLEKPEESAITIGVFDGLHRGHRDLIERVVRRGPNPTVITFRENPRKLTFPANYEGEIYSLAQKMKALGELGPRRIVLIDFSDEFSKIKGRDFMDLLADSGKMRYLAIGSNFRCGHGQDTDAASIREINDRKGIPTDLISPLSLAGGPVSSSRIRRAILSGDLKEAALLMGRNIELDLDGLKPDDLKPGGLKPDGFKPGGFCYDLRSVQRLVPKDGQYRALIFPLGERSAKEGQVFTENGKLFLPEKAESIEFI